MKKYLVYLYIYACTTIDPEKLVWCTFTMVGVPPANDHSTKDAKNAAAN